MSPTSQYWSSKPQVIMVATVSLTMASTSTLRPCMMEHLVSNKIFVLNSISSNEWLLVHYHMIMRQAKWSTPFLSLASLRIWTTSLFRRPRTWKFLLQCIKDPYRESKFTREMYFCRKFQRIDADLQPYLRPYVHRGKKKWRPEDASSPNWFSFDSRSPSETLPHGQTAKGGKKKEEKKKVRIEQVQHVDRCPCSLLPTSVPFPVSSSSGIG